MSIARMKGLRQKTGSATYGDLVPFGTDGSLVDMNSGLDLETENKIGQNHYVEIRELNDSTTSIQETYAKKSEVTAGTATNYYQKDTTIIEQSDRTTITEQLWWRSTPGASPQLVKEKTTTIIEGSASTTIEEVLT